MPKPLFIWAGGKNKMLKHYLPLLPSPFDSPTHYCEPFFGGGAMFIHAMETYQIEHAFLNDINPDIIRVYSSIRDHLSEFQKRIDQLEAKYLPLKIEDRKTYYYEVREEHAWHFEKWNEVEESATLYFLMKTGFNGIFQINQNTNGRYGTPSGLLNQKDVVYNRADVEWWHEALKITTLTSTDWKECAESAPDDSYFFFDPPYRESCADYGNAFSDEKCLELIEFCQDKPTTYHSNRADDDWFEDKCGALSYRYFPVTYTAGRRKRTGDGFEAKKAREILLYS